MALHRTEPTQATGNSICVIANEIALGDLMQEAVISMVALAQVLAIAGNNVTLLWMPDNVKSGEEVERATRYFLETYNIRLQLFRHAEENVQQYNGPEYRSFGIYKYLKQSEFDSVYFPLEKGRAYYTLLGKATGVYPNRPRLIVVAHSPIEWISEADRSFFNETEQVKFAFMERYCAREPDTLICISKALQKWFTDRDWVLPKDCIVLPALTPREWVQDPEGGTEYRDQQRRELVLIATHRFRDGLTLFCDTLDEISKFSEYDDIRVTAIGPFGKILGEHTGGILIRRGRRWAFPIRLINKLTLLEGIHYAKQHNAIAVIPNTDSATGYSVSECIRLGVPFVATSVGGNVGHTSSKMAAKSFAEPNPASLASSLLNIIESPALIPRLWNSEAKERLWTDNPILNKPLAASVRKSRKSKNNPLVSVIVTHYERPQYLLQAIASLSDQNYKNFEVILVDDGSKSPEAHAVLDRLETDFQKKKHWKVVRAENRYVGAARNTGVKASRGEYIVFIDDDNALFPEAISTFVNAIETSESDVCMALAKTFYQSNVPSSARSNYVTYIPLGGCLELGLLGNVFGDTISIYRRSVFDKAGYQLEKFNYRVEDWEFFIRMTLCGLKLTLIPEVLFWYRISTEGRYRSSHFYDNLRPIIDTFAKHGYRGLEHLYIMYVGQNLNRYQLESANVNLTYSPSDEQYLELAKHDPNSSTALTLLAKIAASEGREDTAVNLLAQLKADAFSNSTKQIGEYRTASFTAIREAAASLMIDHKLSVNELMLMETWTSAHAEAHPLSYVEEPDSLYLESKTGALSVAVLAAACPASTRSVLATISLAQAESEPAEFLLLLCPMHLDPLVAAMSAYGSDAEDGVSGWITLSTPGLPSNLEARLSTPSTTPLNLVVAVRSQSLRKGSVLGCFAAITIRTSVSDRISRRPRLGAPEHKLRARYWTEAERKRIRLLTHYKSELPLLLFPKEFEGGIFIRPSSDGPVVAVMDNAFPAYAREILGKVEVAHEHASAFEFAMALTIPGQDTKWKAAGPRNAMAFSGWIRVEEKFKLHEIRMRITERLPTPLSVSFAVKLPRGSNPNPSNAFWRSVVFFWD